jgi:hypothetical protein
MTSESTKFLGHPRLTRQTLSFTEKIIAKQRPFSNENIQKELFYQFKKCKINLFMIRGHKSCLPVCRDTNTEYGHGSDSETV